MGKDVIVACDFASAEATFAFLDKFANCERKPFLKIGMELYYAEGPSIVKEIKARGHKIFLDLKLHDIPNTVKKAMSVLSNLDVDMVNVHAAGTIDMMKAAKEGLTREDGSRPLLIAVTMLTSTSEERMQNEILIDDEAQTAHFKSAITIRNYRMIDKADLVVVWAEHPGGAENAYRYAQKHQIDQLEKTVAQLEPWGDFDPQSVADLFPNSPWQVCV